jgi:hypothetical protein
MQCDPNTVGTSQVWRAKMTRVRWLGQLVQNTPIVLLLACGAPASATIKGSFVLDGFDATYHMAECRGTDGQSDIAPGLGVTVRDEHGNTIGSGALALDGTSRAGHCAYTFAVAVPQAQSYEISVGTRARDTYSVSELAAAGWTVAMKLGDGP